MTATPDFTPPKRTRPFLVTSTADPDPRSVQILDSPPSLPLAYNFSVDVVGDDQGQQVLGRFYIDYGKPNIGGQPFNQVVPITPVDPGTMTDTKTRRVKASGGLAYPLEPGCHTATLIVSHDFTEGNCPVCLNDSSQISWPLFRCNSLESPESCKPDFSGPGCESFAPGCPAVGDPSSGVECGDLP